ncbi:MAG: helix-turn-helix transcriptional regulator [Schaedlerella sp.]|nr:helix-turn-helix transcriptional regulator [Schaedlerella sp.]
MKNRVKELRKERNLKQTELAEKVNTTQQTISRIENGENTLPADTLIALAKFFGVSIDYILCLTDSRRTNEAQIAYNNLLEKNYRLCAIFEKLSVQNQELIYKLVEQLLNTK